MGPEATAEGCSVTRPPRPRPTTPRSCTTVVEDDPAGRPNEKGLLPPAAAAAVAPEASRARAPSRLPPAALAAEATALAAASVDAEDPAAPPNAPRNMALMEALMLAASRTTISRSATCTGGGDE